MKTQHSKTIKVLQSDRGDEYTGKVFTLRLEEDGTEYDCNMHDTPEYNGTAERSNCTISERVRALFKDSGLLHFLWAEAVRHAVFLKNHSPTTALRGTMPFEAMYSSKPNLQLLRMFRERIWVHDTSQSKLESRARLRYWLGFDSDIRKNLPIEWLRKCRIVY